MDGINGAPPRSDHGVASNLPLSPQEQRHKTISRAAVGTLVASGLVMATHLLGGFPKSRAWFYVAAATCIVSFFVRRVYGLSSVNQQQAPAAQPKLPLPLVVRTIDLRDESYNFDAIGEALDLWEQTDRYIFNTEDLRFEPKNKRINDFIIELLEKINPTALIQSNDRKKISHVNRLLQTLESDYPWNYPRISIVGDHLLLRQKGTQSLESTWEFAQMISHHTVGIEVRYGSSLPFKTWGTCARNELDDAIEGVDQAQAGDTVVIDLKLEEVHLKKLFAHALQKKVFLNFKECELPVQTGQKPGDYYEAFYRNAYNLALTFLMGAVRDSAFRTNLQYVDQQLKRLAPRIGGKVMRFPIEFVGPPEARVIHLHGPYQIKFFERCTQVRDLTQRSQLPVHCYPIQINGANGAISPPGEPHISQPL